MPSQDEEPLPSPHWVYSVFTTVNIANDRSWFGEDYTPFNSYLKCKNGQELEVIGVGSVTLRTQRCPDVEDVADPGNHSSITLPDVFHVPDALCNVIGSRLHLNYDTKHTLSSPGGGPIFFIGEEDLDTWKAFMAQLDPDVDLLQLQLSPYPIGPKVGPYSFEQPYELTHALEIRGLRRGERKRLNAILTHRCPSPDSPLLDTAENTWLQSCFGDECKLLSILDLNIRYAEDRRMGRRVVRKLMKVVRRSQRPGWVDDEECWVSDDEDEGWVTDESDDESLGTDSENEVLGTDDGDEEWVTEDEDDGRSGLRRRVI